MKLRNLFLIALCLFVYVGCDETDSYYDRPEWLEDPIYQVLEQEGRFTSYLQCVDRTDYAKVLKGASLSTVFAPNDEAFSVYLKENGYASVADIPDDVVRDLVGYSIVYNKWESDHLSDTFVDGEYTIGALKRKTNTYAGPYKDPEFEGNWVVDQTSRSGYAYTIIDYQVNFVYQNYKYLPIYTSEYFNSFPVPLTAMDYNTFYPGSQYTGKNVQGGTILKTDIRAENGVIHEVSTVNKPLENMDDMLKDPEYVVFKSLIDYKLPVSNEYIFKQYVELPATVREAFQKRLPNETINSLYYKMYQNIAFSPILENIFNTETGAEESEINGNTLFIPTDEALNDYLQNRILKHYGSLDKLPPLVIAILINTHMVNSLVWPTTYSGSYTSMGEFLNGEGLNGKDFFSDGVLKSRVASNGFIHQIDHVIKSRYFETVYADIFLNPNHLLLDYAYSKFYPSGLKEELMKSPLNGNISERYTILNFSDQLLTQDGFSYDNVNNNFLNAEMTEGNVEERLKRLMLMHVFPGVKNNEVNSEVVDFMQSPISNYNGWGFLTSYYGDVIRYKNNQLQAVGNIEDGSLVTISKVEDEFNNGYVYSVDRMLQYSPRETAADIARFQDLTLWDYLDRARTENPNVSQFVDYVEYCLKAQDSKELDGIKAENFYTVLMVNNSAMNQARTRGYIQPIDSVNPATNGNDSRLAYVAQATMFLNAHFIQGTALPDDGLNYLYPVNPMSPNKSTLTTLHRITNEELGLVSQRTYVEVSKSEAGLLQFTPQDVKIGSTTLVKAGFGTTAAFRVQRGSVIGSPLQNNFRSNRIASRAVLHEVNNFFTFTEQNP